MSVINGKMSCMLTESSRGREWKSCEVLSLAQGDGSDTRKQEKEVAMSPSRRNQENDDFSDSSIIDSFFMLAYRSINPKPKKLFHLLVRHRARAGCILHLAWARFREILLKLETGSMVVCPGGETGDLHV